MRKRDIQVGEEYAAYNRWGEPRSACFDPLAARVRVTDKAVKAIHGRSAVEVEVLGERRGERRRQLMTSARILYPWAHQQQRLAVVEEMVRARREMGQRGGHLRHLEGPLLRGDGDLIDDGIGVRLNIKVGAREPLLQMAKEIQELQLQLEGELAQVTRLAPILEQLRKHGMTYSIRGNSRGVKLRLEGAGREQLEIIRSQAAELQDLRLEVNLEVAALEWLQARQSRRRQPRGGLDQLLG